MTTPSGPDVVHLNADNVWRGFHRRGLDIVGGRLRLASLPSWPGPVVAGPPPTGPSGLAVDPDATIFFTDAAADLIAHIDGCDSGQAPLPCVGGQGAEPTQLRDPAGMVVHPGRGALLVADSGNDRVQLFDLHSHQLLDVWGGFDRPLDLDADPDGGVYVADRGRVQRFTEGGEVDRGFAVAASLTDPVGVAVLAGPAGPVIGVLDRARAALLVVGPDGRRLAEVDLDVTAPLGLAVTAGAIYVGDGGAVVRLRWDGSRVGVATGWSGPVAALALDGRGGLLVHPGGSGPPVRLALDTAFVRHGIAWGGPFGGFDLREKQWHRLVATLGELPADAHAQFFVHTADSLETAPPIDESAPDPFPATAWSPGPPDLGEFLVRSLAARYAWVGVRLSGQGASTAEVEQIRLEFDRASYLENLPALYGDEAPDAFLPRYLALAQGLFGEVEDETASLSRLVDPAAAPEPFLAALARWLAVDVEARWDTAELRDAVACAYTESAGRGTAAGLRRAVRRATGVDVGIEEPAAAWWALASGEDDPSAERETSVLGVTTMLAAAEPQGAVLGSTATVDRSHLIENAEYGMPLFDAVAHRFTVRVYRGATYSPDRLAAVEAVVERERPAHTEYAICAVDPGLPIGTGRIGIDTVLAGDPPPTRLDGAAVLGDRFVLGGEPPGRIGQRGGIGVATRLGSAAVRDR
jgi:phage tail-like protein